MSKPLGISVFILLLAVGCARSTPDEPLVVVPSTDHSTTSPDRVSGGQHPQPHKQVPTPSVPSSTVIDTYPDIPLDFTDYLNIPGKFSCSGYSLSIPDPNKAQSQYLILEPSGQLLIHFTNKSFPRYDVTFSKDCDYLYYVTSVEHTNDLFVVDLNSGKTSVLAIPDLSFPVELSITL